MHRIDIVPTRLTSQGQLYSASYGGETIVTDSLSPEFEAARVLHARGLTGKAQTYMGNPYPHLIFDLCAASRLMADSSKEGRPTLSKHRLKRRTDQAQYPLSTSLNG